MRHSVDRLSFRQTAFLSDAAALGQASNDEGCRAGSGASAAGSLDAF